MIQLGDNSIEGEELKFAPMPAGEKIETVTLEKAMQMFALPRLVGKTEDGDEITANIGQYGPYIKIKNLFVSIKPLSPFEISEKEAQMLYAEKLKNDEKRVLKRFKNGIVISRGGFGRKYIIFDDIKSLIAKRY